MAAHTYLFDKSSAAISTTSACHGIRSALLMSLLLSSTLMASEPDEAPIAERGRMGIEAYTRVLDALEVPDAQRVSADTVTVYSGAYTVLKAMQTAREAQREALKGADRQPVHIGMPDTGVDH